MAAADDIAPTRPAGRRFGGASALLRPRLIVAWRWWTAALASTLPLRLRERLGLLPQRLLVRSLGSDVALSLERPDRIRPLAELPGQALADDVDGLSRALGPQLAELPRWLVLPASAGLRRPMRLPAAAADRLRDVVAFEIDRQTPFAADAVAFDARALGPSGDGHLDAELVVVPRQVLDAALNALGPAAQTLAGVDLDDGDGGTLGVDLLPPARRQSRRDPWRRANALAAVIAVCALAAGMWQMLENRRAAADRFEADSQPVIAQAREAALQRDQLVGTLDGMRYLESQRAGRPSMVEILDELSQRLPDSTYLERLSIENDRLLLIGLSSEASALVGQLEGSPLWRAPALTGALMPDPRSRRDRFTLSAELVVAPAADAAPATTEAADADG